MKTGTFPWDGLFDCSLYKTNRVRFVKSIIYCKDCGSTRTGVRPV